MKASLLLLWYRLFNRKNLWKIEFSSMQPFECGDLITVANTIKGVEGYDRHLSNYYVRYIKNGWVVKTDGMYPWYLVVKDKILSFFRFTVSFWYLDFIRFLCRIFPSLANQQADSSFAKIIFWPLKNSWK